MKRSPKRVRDVETGPPSAVPGEGTATGGGAAGRSGGLRVTRAAHRLHLGSALLLATLVGLLLLPPFGAQAFGYRELTCGSTWDLVQSLLKRHISFRQLTPELRERAVDVYLEQVDPSKTLFLTSEVDAHRKRLIGVFFGMQNENCALLEDLHQDLVVRYERMEEEVRAFVSDPEYAIDRDAVLILDPKKRGHAPNDEARRKLVERLVHFQIANYVASDMELAEAKEKLIHRYELMTKRAKELEPRDVYGNFLNAFAGALDPHSAYYPPEAVEDFEIQMRLSLDGIGVALSSKDGYSIVENIIPAGPTDKAKALEPGDKIIAVAQDGEDPVDIVDMSLRDVVAMIRGERGTPVRLTVLRQGETTERLEVEIVRDKVEIEDAAATLDFHEIEIQGEKKKFALLELPTFYGDPDPSNRQSGRDVRDMLRRVREAGADGVVLDLSRNGGGKLESSVEIAGLFIPAGGIVAVKNVFSEVQVLEDPDESVVYDGPLVVLTSRVTASASEIVAGALKDYQRAVIVGDDHTFGKGTVQSFVHQPGRLGAIKVTTALFFRPGGKSTQHEGVLADIVLPSRFATNDLGERYVPYSLGSERIDSFLTPTFPRMSLQEPRWMPVTPPVLAELARRSAERIALDEDFSRIAEELAKRQEDEDVMRPGDLLDEEGSPESPTRDEAEAGSDSDPKAQPDEAGGEQPEGSSEPGKEGDGDASTDYAGAESKRDEPSPQQREALQVLADLIQLQETAEASWHAPQSASRLAPFSSQP